MSDTKMNEIAFEMPKNKSNAIKVIGVGGGGSNAVDYMYLQDIKGVDFVICNTDAQALENSSIPNKIQLGVNLTEGMGAGANPEVGAQSAEESYKELKDFLNTNTKMVFITAGMGGGTGTGAAPIIARIAKELGLLTVGIVTMPFEFEGKSRNHQAQKGIAALREYVDSLIVINNNKLREVYGNLGYKSGFAKADEVLSTAARGIAEVITHHYKQNIDLNDAKTVLQNSGTAIMGSAQAIGDERAKKAIEGALDSPLLNDNKITGAKNVLLLIVSGSNEVTLDEIGEINDHIRNEAGFDVNIIMGVGDDDKLGEAIAVTIIATGFSSGQQSEITETEVKKIVHTLEDNQEIQFDFSEKIVKKKNISPLDKEDIFEDKIIHNLEAEADKNLTPTTEYIKNIDVLYDEISIAAKENSLFDLHADEIEILDTFEMIPTTDVIKDIDITYDEIVADVLDDDEYIINTEEERVEKKSHEQMKLTFDFPIEAEINEELQENDHEIDVENKVQIEPDFSEITTHNLAEFEEEAILKEEDVVKTMVEEDTDLLFELKVIPENKYEEKSEAVLKNNDNKVTDNITPLNASIADFKKTTEARKMHLKKHNYMFHKNPSNIDEIEKEPAYKRQNIELVDNPNSAENTKSRTSIDDDNEDGFKLRSNNSFLHDNVD